MGVTRVWRWSRDRMTKALEDGIVVQTSPGNVPQAKLYLDEQRGRPLSDMWLDIPPLNSQAAERLGYPTQKPLALLGRIVSLAAPDNGVVLDPFCGCGTTVDAAEQLGRRWIGIDITYLAVDLIDKRLRDTHGDSIVDTYTIEGIPHDMDGAQALFNANPFDFERWAVSMVNGQPNQTQVGDRGVDGRIRFALELSKAGTVKRSATAVISVNGGKTVNPAMVRDLDGTVRTENASIGVLILMIEPTRGMKQAAAKGGTYTWPFNGGTFPRIQIITVQQLLAGQQPKIPPAIANPYKQAKTLFDDAAEAQALF